MAHLIDKDTLVAEIENLLDKGKYHEEYDCAYRDGNNGALYALKGKLNTFEVKEVDLENEYIEEVYSHLDGIKDTADRMTSGNFMHNRAAIKFSANTIAKVLELIGLKAQKGK